MLCMSVGISRQGYYKSQRFRERRKFAETKVLEIVKRVRLKHPKLGGRKLFYKLHDILLLE